MPCRLLLLTSLVAVALTGCAALFGQGEPLEVFVIALSPEETGLLEQRVRVDVRVLNPNQFDLHVTGMEFKVDLNGTRFARGLSSQDVTIPRLGEGNISVVASATTMSLLKQLFAMGKGQALTYEIKGSLYLKDAPVNRAPFENSGILVEKDQLFAPPAGEAQTPSSSPSAP